MVKKSIYIFILVSVVGLSCSSCSPVYVTKAGWEEAKILWRREKISKLIEEPDTDQKTKEKLKLVLEAREFSKNIGLIPKDSFTLYSKVETDELLWVLSATPKTSFSPVTWWFPIVGSIPYKGFFEKKDAEEEANKLKEKGNDVFFRPSAAFSTLGWFNDPLLSTTLKQDEISLIDTVIHEILHNTIFIKSQVEFNESLANFIGCYGVYQFYLEKYGSENEQTIKAFNRIDRQIEFSKFIEDLVNTLNMLYAEYDQKKNSKDLDPEKLLEDTLLKKKQIIQEKIMLWYDKTGQSKESLEKIKEINNATILATKIYITKTERFFKLFSCLGKEKNLKNYIELLKQMAQNIKENKSNPYDELEKEISNICSNNSN